jgi:hypothetical protein
VSLKKILAVVFASIFYCGCASIRNENVAVPVESGSGTTSKDILISAKLVEELSSQYFGYFDFTIENQSENWHVVQIDSVIFPDAKENTAIRFPSGDTLVQWQKCMARIIAIDEYNKGIALGTIAGIGLIAAASSRNETVSNLGASTALGTIAYASASEIKKEKDSLERASNREPNHLLNGSSLVLPGLFEKKWLLVNTSDHKKLGYLERMRIKYKLNGQDQEVELKFRNKDSSFGSKWQNDARPVAVEAGSPHGNPVYK